MSAAIAAAGAALTATLGVAPSAYAAPDTAAPTLVDIELGTTTASASGFGVSWVGIRLHLTDDSGVARHVDYDYTNGDGPHWNFPSAQLLRSHAGRGQVMRSPQPAAFALVSGTAQDGWWAGKLPVTSGYDGTFDVGFVAATDTVGNLLFLDPRTLGITRQLRVTGTHIPHLSMRQTPDPLSGVPRDGKGPLSFYGHLTDLETGNPLVATAHFGFGLECIRPPGGGPHAVTSSNAGAWRIDLSYWVPAAGCASVYNFRKLADPDPQVASQTIRVAYVELPLAPHYRWPLTATMTPTQIKVGGHATVTGHCAAAGEFVRLQRLVSGSWRTVATGSISFEGRFTLTAAPSTPGNWRYRIALLPATKGELASYSVTMLLGVTSG